MSTLILLGVLILAFALRKNRNFQEYLILKGWRPTLNPAEKELLQKYFEYYRQLSKRDQRLFRYKVHRFRRMTTFIPRQMDEVTDEMQVLISASAVQLTFGFQDVLLDHFENIVVYPDQFFSHAGQRYHKGEVNPAAKAIVLSWKHFVHGYAEQEGVNLGLHEMAHALQLENIIFNDEFGFMEAADLDEWQALASKEMKRMRAGNATFFRAYGATSHTEFFAVAVENFFERPKQFQDHSRSLYSCMSRLLKQDPLILLRSY
ncbi:zinc-dependent peptidase [Marinoscillum furvescens]|uniref:DgsA anti-repressor MtfA n=1 Tax=Marinoscillum furvescens DSM 4134 TaxID=1122208 RepID=A0A3D9KVP9_MARFU|nr:zinc-dependent peptidase [Marinoscillum furvescens]RED91632.1 hypothetical protein C7460_1387 [Marinoscillum furvescens DSM 4134]